MQKFSYSPPKFKPSTKIIDVMDEQGNVVCKFKRTYKNLIAKIGNYIFDIDWSVQYDAYSNDGDIVFQSKKVTKWFGRPEYNVFNCKTNEEFNVSYKTWQKIAPEFLITNNTSEYVLKKELMDWVRFYHQGKEVARWNRKATELFKTYLEIEEDCPIQDPEFFICLFQNIFYVGD
ncbi:tubby C-terminal domain-like protein [Niallia sp. 01092]|uniref:tubby C-terminal domain-like protein n=1 Tax=unclassified Niallia TaxID=2837522 RepID=UPI003FD2007C